MIYARFRWDATHAEPALGRGWLVSVGSALAKPNGKVLGEWVERRGRPPEGGSPWIGRGSWCLPRSAGTRAGEEEARQRANDARVRLGDAVERWLAARKVDDPGGEREAWKHSHAKNMTNYARRFARELGPDRYVDTIKTAELRRWLAEDLKPMRNGVVLDSRHRGRCGRPTRRRWPVSSRTPWRRVDEQDPTLLPAYRTRRKRSDDPLRREEYLTKAELRKALDQLRRSDRLATASPAAAAPSASASRTPPSSW